jgi:hypothetical protein
MKSDRSCWVGFAADWVGFAAGVGWVWAWVAGLGLPPAWVAGLGLGGDG